MASAHGQREFSLPSGERHRLRFVQPWSPSVTAALLKSTESPFHVPNSKDHKEILIYTGGTTVVVRFYLFSTCHESILCVSFAINLLILSLFRPIDLLIIQLCVYMSGTPRAMRAFASSNKSGIFGHMG